MMWRMRYFQVKGNKKVWTQAAIRCLLIWTMLNSTGKMINWMYTLFLDRAMIFSFHQRRLTTWRWEVQQKTLFWSTKRKTKRTLLQQQQQHQSLRDQHDPLHCWQFVHLEQEQKMFQILSIKICFNRYCRVCVLI